MDFGKPVNRTWASFNNFVGKLVVIIPQYVGKSGFPKQNRDGQTYYPDQTVAYIVPVESVEGTNNQGKPFAHEVGKPVISGITVKARNQLGEMGEPILARVVKGQARNGAGAPTILQDPTPEEVELARSVLADFDASGLAPLTDRGSRDAEPEQAPQVQPVVTPERAQTPPWKAQ